MLGLANKSGTWDVGLASPSDPALRLRMGKMNNYTLGSHPFLSS